VSVVASHQITREWREYERTSTTVMSAYVQPVAHRYLTRLLAGVRERRFGGTALRHAVELRGRLRLARKYGRRDGLERLIAGIRHVARSAGRPGAYHVTITRAWFELISSADGLADHDELFDKTLLERYYSPEQLASGREQWLEPDLQPLRLPVQRYLSTRRSM
jgi:hypothetical protein